MLKWNAEERIFLNEKSLEGHTPLMLAPSRKHMLKKSPQQTYAEKSNNFASLQETYAEKSNNLTTCLFMSRAENGLKILEMHHNFWEIYSNIAPLH